MSFDYQWFIDNVNYTIGINQLNIYDENYNYLNLVKKPLQPIIIPNTYVKEQFQNPYVRVLLIDDKGIDLDGNGKFEYIEFSFNVQITGSFSYLYFNLNVGNTSHTTQRTEYLYNVQSGTYTIKITINTIQFSIDRYSMINLIQSLNINGYDINRQRNFNMAILTNKALPNPIQYSDFDPFITVEGYTTKFVDLNNDSLFDVIYVDATITTKSSINIKIDLYFTTNPYSNGFTSYKNEFLPAGTNVIRFTIYPQIFSSIQNSPFDLVISNLRITNTTSGWEQLYDSYYTVAIFHILNPNQFDYLVIDYSIASIQPVDFNSDNKYDVLAFTFTITSKLTLSELSITTRFSDIYGNNTWYYFKILATQGKHNYTQYALAYSGYFNPSISKYSLQSIEIRIRVASEEQNLVYLSGNELLTSGKSKTFDTYSGVWSVNYYYYNMPTFNVYIDGKLHNSNYEAINLTSGRLVPIDVQINSGAQFINYIKAEISERGLIFYLNMVNTTFFTGYLDLTDFYPITDADLIFYITDMFNGCQQQYFRLNVIGDPNAPHVQEVKPIIPANKIYEGDSFVLTILIYNKNNTVTSVVLFTGQGSNFVPFTMTFDSSSSNSSFSAWNVSAYLNNYWDDTLKFEISYINNQSIQLKVTDLWNIDYKSFIKDDLDPIISNTDYPQAAKINDMIFLSFIVSDDRGINSVLVKYKYQNGLTATELTPDSNTTNGLNSYTYFYSFKVEQAHSLNLLISVTDSHGQVSTKSLPVVVSDYGSPSVKSYTITPTTISQGDLVTITIVFNKQSEVITSVTLKIDSVGTYAFEKTDENSLTETWVVSLTASQAGTFNYHIVALNTANKNTNVDFSVTVIAKQIKTITTSPGFEMLMVLLGFVMATPMLKKLKKRS